MQRIKNILLQPKSEWENIAREDMTIGRLYARYILPLAAIIPLSVIISISSTDFSQQFPNRKLHIPMGLILLMAVVSYLANILIVLVTAVIANVKAPSFLGEKNFIQAMKVATFSQIPYWIVGVIALVPSISLLQLFAFYSFYLFYLGLPILMKVPHEKGLSYTITVLALSIAALLGIGISIGIPLVAVLNSIWPEPLIS